MKLSMLSLVTVLVCILLSVSSTTFAATIFTVDGANGNWQDTGIDLIAGDQLRITATGSIFFKSGYDPVGPDGMDIDEIYFDGNNLLPSAKTLTLVGVIGETAAPEGIDGYGAGFIGSDYLQTVTTSGRLYLGFNDSAFNDNSGSFLANISTVPVPGAIWMLGSGLAGLASLRRKN